MRDQTSANHQEQQGPVKQVKTTQQTRDSSGTDDLLLNGVERRFRAVQCMLSSSLERLQTELRTRQRDRKNKEINSKKIRGRRRRECGRHRKDTGGDSGWRRTADVGKQGQTEAL